MSGGIIDYQLVKKQIAGKGAKFYSNNALLLKKLDDGEFEEFEPRLISLCLAIA